MDSEENWQAGSDARTLSEAEGIKADKKRHGAAKKHAATEAQKMAKVAGMGVKPIAPSIKKAMVKLPVKTTSNKKPVVLSVVKSSGPVKKANGKK